MKRKREWDVVVVGGVGTDYLARADELPTPEHAAQGEQFLEVPGGKGLNAAVAAARLGARVGLMACVGSDERGDRCLALLQAERVDIDHVRRAAAPTGATIIQVARDGRKQTLGVPGANASLTEAHMDASAPLLTGARILLAQLEPPLKSIRRAVGISHAAGVRVILDPAPPVPLDEALLAQISVIKPNANEAEALTGRRVIDRASGVSAAELLLSKGVGAVVVEAGEGTLLKLADEEHWLPRHAVDTIDTTGAGDTLAAGIAVALAEGFSLFEAATLGNAAAALATTRLGAFPSLPRRAEVLDLLQRAGGPAIPAIGYGS